MSQSPLHDRKVKNDDHRGAQARGHDARRTSTTRRRCSATAWAWTPSTRWRWWWVSTRPSGSRSRTSRSGPRRSPPLRHGQVPRGEGVSEPRRGDRDWACSAATEPAPSALSRPPFPGPGIGHGPGAVEAVPHRFPFRWSRSWTSRRRRLRIVLGTARDADRNEPWPVTLVAEALAQAILLVEPPDRSASSASVGCSRRLAAASGGAGDRLRGGGRFGRVLGALRRYRCRRRPERSACGPGDVITVSEVSSSATRELPCR